MVELGDEVKDKISGFKGIATGEHRYLQGCRRFTVCSQNSKDPKEMSFDEPQLVVIKKKKIKIEKPTTSEPPGGVAKYEDTPKVM